MDLLWDGSYLGKIEESSIIEMYLWEIKPWRYVKLQWYNQNITCLAKVIKTHFPNIIDELKPYFGLSKLGTHSLHIGKNLYLLIHNIPNIVFSLDQLNQSIDSLYFEIYCRYPQPLNEI